MRYDPAKYHTESYPFTPATREGILLLIGSIYFYHIFIYSYFISTRSLIFEHVYLR